MGVGSKIPIVVEVFGISENLSVTVQAISAQSMTFTTNPGHLLYPAHITFAASAASSGSINFNIDLAGSIAQPVRFNLAGSGFEDAQWRHFLDEIKAFCKKGS